MKKDLYKIIGVDKKASKDEIKKQYRKKAMENHPDKGGDKEIFNEMTICYKILSDDEKRARYDAGEDVFEKEKHELEIITPILMEILFGHFCLDTTDVIGKIKEILENKIMLECQTQMKFLNDRQSKIEKMLKRLKVKKKKNNLLKDILQGGINEIKNGKLVLEAKEKYYRKAIKFLADYSYDTDEIFRPVYISFNSTTV